MILKVFSYWAGPMPEWIRVCLESLRRKCVRSTFILLTPETASSLVPDLNPRWLDLPPGVGTDCLRAHLLANHGGLWIDADTVCLEDPAKLITNRHLPRQFLYSRWKDKRPVAGYVYAPHGHPVACRWRDGVDSALLHAEAVGWGELGEKLLLFCLSGMTTNAIWEIPLSTFLPVDIDQNVEELFSQHDWQTKLTDVTIGFGLNHSWMMENRRQDMEEWPVNPRLMIHKLLRHARSL